MEYSEIIPRSLSQGFSDDELRILYLREKVYPVFKDLIKHDFERGTRDDNKTVAQLATLRTELDALRNSAHSDKTDPKVLGQFAVIKGELETLRKRIAELERHPRESNPKQSRATDPPKETRNDPPPPATLPV